MNGVCGNFPNGIWQKSSKMTQKWPSLQIHLNYGWTNVGQENLIYIDCRILHLTAS